MTTWFSRRQLLGLTVPTALLLTGCVSVTTPPTTSTSPPGTVAPLPPNRRVFWVNGTLGYFATAVDRAVDAPPLLMYGDGRVLRSGQRVRSAPSPYLRHQVDPMAVARFVADATAIGVVAEDVDFGEPGVTDLGSTSVVLDGLDGRHRASAYALDERFDDLVDTVQRERRRALRRVIQSGQGLIGNATGEEYVPDRIGIQRLANRSGAGSATVVWPGPDLARFLRAGATTGCGQLAGSDAATVYRAAMANPGQRWLVEGVSVTLAVNPLAIGLNC